jgi:hypothetical protein
MRDNFVRLSDAEKELVESVLEESFDGDAPLGLAVREACEVYLDE